MDIEDLKQLAQSAQGMELIEYTKYLQQKNREHFDACLGCDEQLKEVQKQRDEVEHWCNKLEYALERLVDLANNDGLWCNYDEVIHAEAVLELLYKSRQ